MRDYLANLMVPFLLKTNTRFGQDYYTGKTLFHRLVHSLINTIEADNRATQLMLQGWGF